MRGREKDNPEVTVTRSNTGIEFVEADAKKSSPDEKPAIRVKGLDQLREDYERYPKTVDITNGLSTKDTAEDNIRDIALRLQKEGFLTASFIKVMETSIKDFLESKSNTFNPERLKTKLDKISNVHSEGRSP